MRPALHALVTAAWDRALAEGRVSATNLPPAAVDFETFYRTEKRARSGLLDPCSVELMGNWAYCRHREWHAYLVALYSPAHAALGLPEVRYVGPVADAPWPAIAGRTWVSHHRNFDRHVYERCVELGQIAPHPSAPAPGAVAGPFTPTAPTTATPTPAIGLAPTVPTQPYPWAVWHDTADLAVYCHLPRALGKIVPFVYTLELDKATRTAMDGVRWVDVPLADRPRLHDYALEDAAACALVWLDHQHRWPEEERFASLHTGEIEFRGIAVDVAQIDRDLAVLDAARWRAIEAIPWYETKDEAGKPIALRSKRALDRECLKCGVPAPDTTDVKTKEFQEWLDQHGQRVPAILALARYRSIDRAFTVYRHLRARIRRDGRAALGLKYMGADKTGRWSGGSKFNLQNLLKVPLAFHADHRWADDRGAATHTVDIRRCLVAGPGHRLVIPDLAQIEPRVLAWLAGNERFLAHCRQGLSPYEAHARDSGHAWTGKLKHTQPGLYALFKARVLALGYGAGWEKFIGMARGYCESEAQFLAIFAAEPAPGDAEHFLSYLRRLADNREHRASRAALDAWPELTEGERRIWINSWRQVTEFRRANPLVFDRETGLTARLERDFRAAVGVGVFENKLPSGRSLQYFDLYPCHGWSARPGNPLGLPTRLYGGKLVENLVQAVARDVFMLGINRLERAGYRVLFHVHDEAVVEAPLEADPAEIARLLSLPPDWAPTLPVASEYEVSTHYKK